MGYTHYFRMKRDLEEGEWSSLCSLARKIIELSPAPLLCEYDSNEPPLVSGDMIVFNGKLEDGHETFWLPRERPERRQWETEDERGFLFCKTAQKPYDTAVAAMLYAMHFVAPDAFIISSDGDLPELEVGKVLAEQAAGAPLDHPWRGA